jgi:aldehyde:ferredoxin oxidoreductase
VITLAGRNDVAGGSGLAALLFEKYGHAEKAWNDPEQPLIFAIGPLTGYFPLMSKTVCSFKSPYHNQYAESHAGGRSALALRFADYDALVLTGKAKRLSVVALGSRQLEMRDVHYMHGLDLQTTGQMFRRMFGSRASQHSEGPEVKWDPRCVHQCGHLPPLRETWRRGCDGCEKPEGDRDSGRRVVRSS